MNTNEMRIFMRNNQVKEIDRRSDDNGRNFKLKNINISFKIEWKNT